MDWLGKTIKDLSRKKSNVGKYSESAIVLALMYLAIGKDYPYHMAQIFAEFRKNSDYLDKFPGTGILQSKNKLASLLKDMNERGLILPFDNRSIRNRNYYKLNPQIFLFSTNDKNDALNLKIKPTEISLQEIEDTLLKWDEKAQLEENSPEQISDSDEFRLYIMYAWESIEKLECLTFLFFIQVLAQRVSGGQQFVEFLETYVDVLLAPVDDSGVLTHSNLSRRKMAQRRPYTGWVL